MFTHADIERICADELRGKVFCKACSTAKIRVYHVPRSCNFKLPKFKVNGAFVEMFAPRKREPIARFRAVDGRMVEYNGDDNNLSFWKQAASLIYQKEIQ